MKYVKAEWNPSLPGFHTDPSEYLRELSVLQGGMPPGAREFALEPGHYSFRSRRCVKDLELSAVSIPVRKQGRLTITFSPNDWKHDNGLTIEYLGVTHFSIDREQSIDWMESETIVLDEILPHPDGCSHEIALSDSSITVHCADLLAIWGP
ncbi:hypothetical protein [Streptomyces sp. L2]|uniref:hypothetical protein n=1 Tax=Streptomyces sp. L2 TaxID=2162665 RepID=UPI00101306FA|nr:hypothetical protein [Streptomyces sp. L2]